MKLQLGTFVYWIVFRKSAYIFTFSYKFHDIRSTCYSFRPTLCNAWNMCAHTCIIHICACICIINLYVYVENLEIILFFAPGLGVLKRCNVVNCYETSMRVLFVKNLIMITFPLLYLIFISLFITRDYGTEKPWALSESAANCPLTFSWRIMFRLMTAYRLSRSPLNLVTIPYDDNNTCLASAKYDCLKTAWIDLFKCYWYYYSIITHMWHYKADGFQNSLTR